MRKTRQITVTCYKCGKKRKAVKGQAIVWLQHSKYKAVMHKDENGKYYCCDGYGCSTKPSMRGLN